MKKDSPLSLEVSTVNGRAGLRISISTLLPLKTQPMKDRALSVDSLPKSIQPQSITSKLIINFTLCKLCILIVRNRIRWIGASDGIIFLEQVDTLRERTGFLERDQLQCSHRFRNVHLKALWQIPRNIFGVWGMWYSIGNFCCFLMAIYALCPQWVSCIEEWWHICCRSVFF